MLYLTSPRKLRSSLIHSKVRYSMGESFRTEVWTNEVLVDTWEAVRRRNPDQPWLHMKDLYGRHEGETLLILGSGPSLNRLPADTARKVTTLAINRAILPFPARYWLCHDRDAWSENKDAENAVRAAGIFSIQLYDLLSGVPCTLIEADGMPHRWRDPLTRPLYWNETTLGWAIHLAIRMGAKRIYTVGTELSDQGQYDGFVQKGRSRTWQADQHRGVRERMTEMFLPENHKLWKDRDVEILDCSGGALPVPKASIEEIA